MTQARATELPATVALTNLTPNRTPSNRNCVRNQMIVEYVVSAFLKLPIQCICIYRTQVVITAFDIYVPAYMMQITKKKLVIVVFHLII